MWWRRSAASTLFSAKSTDRGLVIKQFVIGNFFVPTPEELRETQTAITTEVTEDTEVTNLGQALQTTEVTEDTEDTNLGQALQTREDTEVTEDTEDTNPGFFSNL